MQKWLNKINHLNYFNKLLFTFMLTFALIGLAGCGSSSDDDENLNSLLNGSHFLAIFAESGSMWNQINDADFNGQGGYDSTIEYDSGGDTGTFTGSYTVAANRYLSFSGTDIVGIVSADGNLFSVVDTNSGDNEILFGISVETSSGMSNSDLSGNYVFCQIRHDGARTKTARFEMTFNGTGVMTGTEVIDSDNGATGNPLTGTYTVADEGGLDLSINEAPLKDFQGHVSQDGNLVVILDVDNDGEVLLMAGLKTTTGANESLLSGNYQMTQFGGGDTSNWTSRINMTSDGAGQITADILADSGGDLSDPPPFAYTIDANGRIGITGSDENGIVSSDGGMFIIVDANEGTDGDLMLAIGIKR